MRICYMFDSNVSPQNFLRTMCIPTVGPSTTTVNSNATFPVYPYLFPLTEMTMIASNYSFVTSLSASCEVMTLRTACIAGCWWLTPVIPATWEAEIRRIMGSSHSWANSSQDLLLGKTPLSKKAHEKSLTFIEQSLMAGPNCQAGQKRWSSPESGRGVAFIEGGG
jgi:hypothetical protein